MVLFGASCSGTVGSGVEARKSFALQDFERVECEGLFEVHVEIEPDYSVTAVADDNILPMVRVSQFGKVLQVKAEGSITNPITPRVEVVVPQLEAVKLDGICNGSVAHLRGGDLEVHLDSMAELELLGEVDALHAKSGGDLRAPHLNVGVAQLELSG